MNNCRELDHVITAYVDGEASAHERRFVSAHIAVCEACRIEVEAESTARHVLRAHAAVARTMGVRPHWRPHVFRLGRPVLPVTRPGVLGALAAAALVVGLLLFRPTSVTAVGVIGDSRCGLSHGGRSPTQGVTCTLNCVKHGAHFVLVSGDTVYRLDTQHVPNFEAFAARRVAVTGALSRDVITLRQVTLAADDH